MNVYDSIKFVVTWLPGENFPVGDTFNVVTMREHANYIKSKFVAGKVLMAGPYVDGSSAMTIFDVQEEQEIINIINQNPACIKGIVKGIYKAWKPVKWIEFS